MPQTFYIESDEEIISVIGRLRSSASEENYFVFPKHALVLQSIVNLRLFQREAKKIGKKVVIVTQDEMGRMLARKAGMESENYSDDFSRNQSHVEIIAMSSKESVSNDAAVEVEDEENQYVMPQAATIGSDDFYSQHVPASRVSDIKAESASSLKLRVRNASPERPPSLNSRRYEKDMTDGLHRKTDISPMRPAAMKPISDRSISPPAVQERGTASFQAAPEQNERIKSFFLGQADNERSESVSSFPVNNDADAPILIASAGTAGYHRMEKKQKHVQKSKKSSVVSPSIGKKVRLVFFVLGTISILSLGGVAVFLLMPKAEVTIVPHSTTRTADFQFNGKSASSVSDDSDIAVRMIEKEVSVSFSATTSGKSDGTAQKSRGSVTISNTYSSDPQTLVATTRIETADGKIFRLTESVTVPGMSGGVPGTVEAGVIADQSGDAYNIDASSFTIPGFKSGPKYSKFSVKSSKAMVGGGNSGSDVSAVTAADRDKAGKDAENQAKETFLEDIKSSLAQNERVLEEQMELTPEDVAALPQVGTVATSFDYKNTFRVRAFIFSEQDIRSKVSAATSVETNGISFTPSRITLSYDESVPNYSDQTVKLRVRASVTLEADIDKEALVQALLGQDEDGISKVLESFPAIQRIQVNFKPEWLIRSVPESKTRVSLSVISDDASE
jgi:hypothetical protein